MRSSRGRRILWLASLAAWLLAKPVFAANVCALPGALDDGIGGTGSPMVREGMGGTGAPTARGGLGGTGAPLAQGGMGGTGAPQDGIGGTGIVGVVTGFASVCVNGAEVHYGENTPVTLNGEPVSASRLGVGQVVRMVARSEARGLVAQSIAIEHAVVGPPGRMDAAARRLEVLGQTVRFAPEAVRDAAGRPASPESLRAAPAVQVSGLRTPQGELLATRIEPAPSGTRSAASGTLTRVDPGRAMIGAMEVDIGSLPDRARLAAGQHVVLSGRAEGGRLRAEAVREGASLEQARLERVVAQGVVTQRGSNAVEASGLPRVVFDSATRIRGGAPEELKPGALVRVSAVREAGGWRAQQIAIQSERDLHIRAGREFPDLRGKPEPRGGESGQRGREEGGEDRSGHSGSDGGPSARDSGSGTSGRDSGGERDARSGRDDSRMDRGGSSGSRDRIERPERDGGGGHGGRR